MFATKLSLVILLFGFISGCKIYDAEKYVFKKGPADQEVSIEETHWGEMIYKKGEYEFFPRFYTLARSYSSPNSRIIIYSAKQTSIYIESVEIVSSRETYSDQIVFEKRFLLDKFNDEKKQAYTSIELFDHTNTDLPDYWSEGDITVTLRYFDYAGEEDSIIFAFKLWKGKDIAWPT